MLSSKPFELVINPIQDGLFSVLVTERGGRGGGAGGSQCPPPRKSKAIEATAMRLARQATIDHFVFRSSWKLHRKL